MIQAIAESVIYPEQAPVNTRRKMRPSLPHLGSSDWSTRLLRHGILFCVTRRTQVTPLDLFVVPVAIEGGLNISAYLFKSSIVLLIPQFCPHRPRLGLLCKAGQPLV